MDTQEKKKDEEIFKINWNDIIRPNQVLVSIGGIFIILFFSSYFWFVGIDEFKPNELGDYFGGVLNPMLGFVSFIAILGTIALQRYSIKLQREELKETQNEFKIQSKIFNKQQFEETFFSLLKIFNELKDKKSTRFYSSLVSICHKIRDYSQGDKEIEKEYNDILKLYLDDDDLTEIFLNDNIICVHTELYNNVKNSIEEHSLFEYLKLKECHYFQEFRKENELTYNEDNIRTIKYKLSAFKNNHSALPFKVQYACKNDIEEYIKNCQESNDHLLYLYILFNESSYDYIQEDVLFDKINQIKFTTYDILIDENIMQCILKFLLDDKFHKNNMLMIKNAIVKLLLYFEQCIFMYINEGDIKEINKKKSKIDLCFKFLRVFKEVYSETRHSYTKEQLQDIVKYLFDSSMGKHGQVAEIPNPEPRISTLIFLNEIISSTEYDFGAIRDVIRITYEKHSSKLTAEQLVYENSFRLWNEILDDFYTLYNQ